MFRVQESHEAAIVLRNALTAHTTGRIWTNRHPGSDHFHLEVDQHAAADLLAAITRTPAQHHGGPMPDTTTPDHTPPGTAALLERLAALHEENLTNDDGEPAVVCNIDGYPSPMTCTCTHGHNRHSGTDVVHCMSYVGQADCPCTAFVPDTASVSALWLAHTELLGRLDLDKIAALMPEVRASTYVRDWPADEQALWDTFPKDPKSRNDAIAACDAYRRRKTAVTILAAIVGLS